MKRKGLFRKRLFMGIAVLLILCLAAACSSNGGNGTGAAETPNTETSGKETQGEGASKPAEAGSTYPIDTDETLTYWARMNPNLNNVVTSNEEAPWYQEYQKRTGVDLEYISPAIGQEQEAFNVLLASGDLPDMIEWDWRNFPGGPEKAIADGYVLKLNDLIDQYAPNLKKLLADNPELAKQISTDNGTIYAFPFVRGGDKSKVFQGPIIRADWLKKLGVETPTTIDEWHTVLTAFKNKIGAKAPLTLNMTHLNNGAFVGAYGILPGFYQEGGQVKFGAMLPKYKEFLSTFHQWYTEGLLDQNFATLDGKTLDANMTTGVAGATVHNAGGGIGKWTGPLQVSDPNGILTGAPYPVLNKGDKPKFGQKDFNYSSPAAVAISSQSKNPEVAAKLLDYGYGEEGHLFFNFGTEGVSYSMVDGVPTYTDLLMKNPDGLAPAQAISMYARPTYNGPFVQDERYVDQYNQLPQQREAIGLWQTDMDKYQMPPVTPTQEESAEFAAIMNDVNTLVSEMQLKIILGAEPLSAFEGYVEKMKTLKIDRAIEIQQAALERYNNR